MPIRLPLRTALTLLTALAVWLASTPNQAAADVPYETYYKDHFGQLYRAQPAYRPSDAIGGDIRVEDPDRPGQTIRSPLSNPQDLYVDSRDHLYIADTGNNRIVHLDSAGELIRILDVPDSPLNGPQGVFVAENGDIYVADTGNHRIVRLSSEGELLNSFERPDSKLIPESFKYDPVKLVVDKRGFLYIATLGGYQGLLQLDPEGRFQTFFGANKTSFSVVDAVKRLIYSREMYAREIAKLPGSIASVDIGKDGFIYTVTKEVDREQIKKLNIAGLDQLAGKGEYSEARGGGRFGEFLRRAEDGSRPQLSDIAVDADGNMTVIDTKLNMVSQYDASGNLLFFWGGAAGDQTTKLGVVKLPSAVATNSQGSLLILDSGNNIVQTYRLSEFGALVHRANSLTQDGRYEESEPLWAEVARQNAYYSPAVLGLAKAAYKKGEYEDAKKLFKAAGWARGYSDSFWQTRLLWFQNSFGWLMNGAIAAAALYLAWGRLRARYRSTHAAETSAPRGSIQLLRELGHAWRLLKHPIDGFQAIRYENSASVGSSLLLLALAVGSYAVMNSGTSFIFHPERIVSVNLFSDLARFIAVWLCFVVCHYLVSSLRQGEGRFRDVFCGSAYSLFPFVLLGLPITLLSNAMTLSESAIFLFLENGLYVWITLLIFWQAQGIHNYSFGEALVNLLLTVVTMAVCAVLLFIVYSLTTELVHFVYSVYQEVIIR
jgi:tetratricopeptide (TPR) repeat protein